jgi:signal transduction histidine kinase
MPEVRREISTDSFERLLLVVPAVLGYLVVRTVLVFRQPNLPWEYIYPPIDVGIISLLISMGNRDPLSNVALLYMLPVAEAAGTLSVRWAASVAVFVLIGVALATDGLKTTDPFNTWFRYFLMLVMASLITTVARAQAALREQLGVARDRNRIALEMHDGVQGHLITVASQLELAQRLAVQNPERAGEVVTESREMTRQAADELRFLVQRLRAPSLSQGFLPALKQFAHNLCSRNGLGLEFESKGEPYDLDPHAENALFRIAQEALNNVVRHANATTVWVYADFEADHVLLRIRDDGVGFDETERQNTENLQAGLDGMRSRATENGGNLAIRSLPGAGTEVEASFRREQIGRRRFATV